MSLITIANDNPLTAILTVFASGAAVSAGLAIGVVFAMLVWKHNRQILLATLRLGAWLWSCSSRVCVALYQRCQKKPKEEPEEEPELAPVPRDSRWDAFEEPAFLRNVLSFPSSE